MNDKLVLIILILALVLLAAVYFFLSRKEGFSRGKVIYADLDHDQVPAEPLFSRKYGLAGKPDMILRNGNQLIPVEIKSAPGQEHPYPSHLLQLAAYCLLIEEQYGIRPEYGIIQYRDKQFEIPFNESLEYKLLNRLDLMREEDPLNMLPPVCSNRRKCSRCGFRDVCESQEH